MAQQNLSDADTGPVAKSKIQGNFDELYASAVPTGGSLGQVLAKASASDYDTEWATPSGGPPGGSNTQYQINNSGAFGGGNLFHGTNLVDLRNGTAAQAFNVYNTFTDASNYERGGFRWTANDLWIGPESAGSGTLRNPVIGRGSTYFLSWGGSSTSFRCRFWNTENDATVDIYPKRESSVASIESGNTTIRIGPGDAQYQHDFRSDGSYQLTEVVDPSAPANNQARLFCRDNGSGKTQICVRFATGAIQVIATEP